MNKVKKVKYIAGYIYVMDNLVTFWRKFLPEILKGFDIEKDIDVTVEYRLKHSMEILDFLKLEE